MIEVVFAAVSGVVINFELPQYTVRETDGEIEVCARIVDGMLGRDVVVTLSTEDSTALG